MKCPACNTKVREVTTSSHYGIPIVLDQCPSCGGIWFDDSEVYRTKHGAAMKIEERLNVRSLRKFSDFGKELLCPKDGARLKSMSGKHFFNNLEVDICPKCSGVWFNYGVFSKFQQGRIKKQDKVSSRRQALQDLKNEKNISSNIQKQAVSLMRLDAMLKKKRKKDDKRWLVETIIMVLLRLLFKR